MNAEERDEFSRLDTAQRDGKLLTGAELGRLADLRRAEILETVQGLLIEAQGNTPFPKMETR